MTVVRTLIKAGFNRTHPRYALEGKLGERAFAQSHGIPVPKMLAGPAAHVEALPPVYVPHIVKSNYGAGARGVFTSHIPREEVARRVAARRKVRGPFYIEEWLAYPGHPDDFRCWCFAGEVVLIRQTDFFAHRARHWTREWAPLGPITLPGDPFTDDQTLKPPLLPDAIITAAETLSAALGARFVRVDMYDGIFGEFTSAPGSPKRGFVPEWETRLRQAWERTG